MWQPGSNERGCIAVAVADGHGGARHFRSAKGANFAVSAAVDALRRVAVEWEAADPARQSQIASSVLPEAMVIDWMEQVRRHLQSTPITDEEWRALEGNAGPEARLQVQAEPTLAYGATLIAALVTSSEILILQVGDGDALLVGPDGSAWHPIPPDSRLTGEFTTSICRTGAQADFRSSITAFDSTATSLLMLATDGYSNSFRTDADFLRVGTDLLQMVRHDGMSAVEQQLPQILEHASANGSGDDITLALVYLAETGQRATGRLAAPLSIVRRSELRTELASLKRQLHRFRTAVAAIALVALVSLAWTFRAQIEALSAKPLTSGAPRSVPAKPGEVSDTGSEAAPSALVSVSARHLPHAIKISGTVTLTGAKEAQCSTQETLSAPGFPNLGAISKPLDMSSSTGQPIQLETVMIAEPKDPKQRKALQSPEAKASIELLCGGKKVARATTRIEP